MRQISEFFQEIILRKFRENLSVGVFGGTFDPPHLGHVIALNHALNTFHLDCILVLVAPNPWHKAERTICEFEHRLQMTSNCFESQDNVLVSDYETKFLGDTSTFDTITGLTAEYSHNFSLVLGADAANNIGSWRESKKLSQMTNLCIVSRPSFEVSVPAGWTYEVSQMPAIPISSSLVRQKLENGESLHGTIPQKVINHIQAHQLYK